MPTTNPEESDLATTTRQVAADVRNRHRGHIRDLQIELVEGGIILHGVAVTFYGEQIALHEVIDRCALVVVANQINVQARPAQIAAG